MLRNPLAAQGLTGRKTRDDRTKQQQHHLCCRKNLALAAPTRGAIAELFVWVDGQMMAKLCTSPQPLSPRIEYQCPSAAAAAGMAFDQAQALCPLQQLRHTRFIVGHLRIPQLAGLEERRTSRISWAPQGVSAKEMDLEWNSRGASGMTRPGHRAFARTVRKTYRPAEPSRPDHAARYNPRY